MHEKQGVLVQAKKQYEELLHGALLTPAFYTRMISLAVEYPFYFGPYLEMVDYLEARNAPLEREELIQATLKRIHKLLTTPAFLQEARNSWNQNDSQIILQILDRARISPIKSPLLLMRARNLHASLPSGSEAVPKHLIPVKSGLLLEEVRREIAENEIAWSYDTARQDTISFHKHTNAITLRALMTKEEPFVAIDGRHESKRAPLSPLFPHTLKLIEDFAEEMRGGLGRVALVRLKPHSTVYRHFDREACLIGRNRYHLVIHSTQGSFMASGNETRLFKEGDLFQFDNKVMHTAENRSNDWRIHAIFDMKVPSVQ